MERRLLADGERDLLLEALNSHDVVLSLIANPSTSSATLISILNSLIPNHQNHRRRRTISLLSVLYRRLPEIRGEISAALRSFSLLPSTTVHPLSVLFSISGEELADESLFLSLSFQPLGASQRHWLLRNASRFTVRPSILITVALGFTKDPYPLTRKAALDVLACLGKSVVVEDQSLIEGCYFRATELLFDADDSVRCSAIHAVGEWGRLLVTSSEDKCKIEWSDTLFVQLCSTVRDMSMKVRLEAFDALGKVGIVSKEILLQTLAKKASQASEQKSFSGQFTSKQLRLPAASAAFAFVHGLEDEFSEVRRSACLALRNLAPMSADFASELVNPLMDMLNDDSVDVRLQALDTMHHMAVCDLLKLLKGHLQLLLGTLVDVSALIRSATREILQLTKFRQFPMFKSCFEAFVKNMELYPQDEADLLFGLVYIGQNHGSFVVLLVKEMLEEIEPSSGGELGLESVRSIALLVMAISAPVSVEKSTSSIPPIMYSYAASLLGRISQSLAGLVNQDELLSHLFQCSQFTYVSDVELFKGAGNCPKQLLELGKVRQLTADCRAESAICSEIVQKLHNVWPLMHSGFTDEATRTLRGWKMEVKGLTRDLVYPITESAFTLQYLDTIEILGRVWICCMFPLKSCFTGVGILEGLLGQLERSLNELQYTFTGLTREQEVHILEMVLVAYTLKLCSLNVCSHVYPEKLSSVFSRVEHLIEEGSLEPSTYVIELKKTLNEAGHSLEKVFSLKICLEHYSLRQFMFSGILSHMKAELDVPGNYEDPIGCIPGLPVGIPCEISLFNFSSESRVWLKMSPSLHEEFSEFVYLDLDGVSGCDEKRKFAFVAPYYRTPKSKFFRLKVSIALECSCEQVSSRSKFYGGPRGELVKLSEEKEVYLSAEDTKHYE